LLTKSFFKTFLLIYSESFFIVADVWEPMNIASLTAS